MKAFLLFASIIVGIFIPQLHTVSFFIQYLVMFMLFVSYLDIRLHRNMFHKSIFFVFFAKDCVAFLLYFLLLPFQKEFALIAFITAVAPTAMSAPAVVKILKGDIAYMTIASILSNLFITITLPLYLWLLIGSQSSFSVLDMLRQTVIIVFIPLIFAQLVNVYIPQVSSYLKQSKNITLYALCIIIVLIMASSSNFIRIHQDVSLTTLLLLSIISFVICVISFLGGKIIGGRNFALEASQTLGQKNITFSVWFALTFFNPLVALGPTFYLIFYATWNAYQIAKAK